MASPVGLPAELKRDLDAQLPAGVQITPVKIVPTNVSSVVSPTSSLSATANAISSLQGSVQDVIFELPCGQGKNVYWDHRYATLSFRAKYTVETAGTSHINTGANVRSHCMSFFDTATLFGQNGLVLDQINQIGLVCDTDVQLNVPVASRDCMAMAYGFQAESTTANSLNALQGHAVAKWVNGGSAITAGSEYYSYCVPLPQSLIGKDAKKFFAIGSTNRLQFVLRTASVLPITVQTTSSSAAATVSVTLDQFQINGALIDVGPEGARMLGSPEQMLFHGTTYRVSQSTLPAATSGQISILTGLKGSSVRSIITRCSDNVLSTAGAANERYDAKLIPSSATNYNINGVRIPSNPIDLLHNPALAWMSLQECNDSFQSYEFKSSSVPQNFCIRATATGLPTDLDYYISQAGSTTLIGSLAGGMFGYNLEKVSKFGLMDGLNLNAGQTYLEANLGSASLTNANTLFFISKQDVIFVLDGRTGEIQVRM